MKTLSFLFCLLLLKSASADLTSQELAFIKEYKFDGDISKIDCESQIVPKNHCLVIVEKTGYEPIYSLGVLVNGDMGRALQKMRWNYLEMNGSLLKPTSISQELKEELGVLYKLDDVLDLGTMESNTDLIAIPNPTIGDIFHSLKFWKN